MFVCYSGASTVAIDNKIEQAMVSEFLPIITCKLKILRGKNSACTIKRGNHSRIEFVIKQPFSEVMELVLEPARIWGPGVPMGR